MANPTASLVINEINGVNTVTIPTNGSGVSLTVGVFTYPIAGATGNVNLVVT